jgi:hypothetical protein
MRFDGRGPHPYKLASIGGWGFVLLSSFRRAKWKW